MNRVKPVIDPTYGSSDIRMPFVRKIDHLGEIKDTNVPGSSLKTVPDELEILRKKTFHYEIKQVPNILLDQVKIGLDFNLPVKDVVHQKGSPFLHLIAGKICKLFQWLFFLKIRMSWRKYYCAELHCSIKTLAFS